MDKVRQIDCKEIGCERKGFWIETDAAGEKRFCIRTRHDGSNHCQKFTLEEIAEKLNEKAKL